MRRKHPRTNYQPEKGRFRNCFQAKSPLALPHAVNHALGERVLLMASSADGLADCFSQLVFVGERARLELGIEQLASHCQLEAASPGGNHYETTDGALVPRQELGRQTDGLRLIVSKRTVFERDLHRSCPYVVRRPRAPQAARQRRSRLSSSSHVCPVASPEIENSGDSISNSAFARGVTEVAHPRLRAGLRPFQESAKLFLEPLERLTPRFAVNN